jgi:hypothetical protein
LQDEREAFAVREDRECRGRAARLELKTEQAFEEIDRPLNVGNLEIEMIELHGEGRTRAFASWDLTALCGDRRAPMGS